LVHGSGPDGAKSHFSAFMAKDKKDVATKDNFIENQKQETERLRRLQSTVQVSNDGVEERDTHTPVRQLQESANFTRGVRGSTIHAKVDLFE